MYGATRVAAEAIRDGLSESADASCASVHSVDAADLEGVDLLVVGGPTHARSLPRPSSRAEAANWIDGRMRGHSLEPDALGPGVREWLESTDLAGLRAAAFTTRLGVARILSGSALHAITKRLERAGATLEEEGLEVVLAGDGSPDEDEQDRARAWGRSLGQKVRVGSTPGPTESPA